MYCKICGFFGKGKVFSNHVKKEHCIASKDYTIRYVYNGVKPVCAECGDETRYSAWKFKKYCKAHSKKAEAEAGRVGGKAPAWNKGKTKNSDDRILSQSINVSGDKNHFYGKKHTHETRESISKNRKLSIATIESRVGASPGNWKLNGKYITRQMYSDFICGNCKSRHEKKLENIERGASCRICNGNGTSIAENEIENFIKEKGFDVVRNTRSIISPKELDIFVPSAGLAIEHNGLYWHSLPDKDKNSTYDKFIECKNKGIRLIQIFSDEWKNKRSICESLIENALGTIKNKVGARSCHVKRITSKEASLFMNNSHIDGYTPSKFNFALVCNENENIVSVLSLRKPFHNKYGGFLEISRFASLPFYVVPGALSKLLSTIKPLNIKGLLTYVDLRIGTGIGYEKAGFTYDGYTGRSFWYTDCRSRFNRFSVKADKASGLTERNVANNLGVSRIYGPGNYRYIMRF